jgi:hypothetical protein
MYKKRLVAGLCPDPLGELTALPRPPSWFEEGRFAAEEGKEGKEGEGGEGRREKNGNGKVRPPGFKTD